MAEGIAVDTHEPSAMLQMLAQVVPAHIDRLNDDGYADYLWDGIEGSRTQAERKTWQDVLGGMDRIEDQLRRQMEAHPDVRLILLVEGIATPSMSGTTTWYESRTNKRILCAGKEFMLPIQAVYAWVYQVEKFMEVYFTTGMVATARALTAFYKADQKAEHSTFQRYLKQVDWHPNPQVQGLICLARSIGTTRAEALINQFGTVFNVLSASPEQLTMVEGIGPRLAHSLLRGVGRTDV